MTQFHRFHDAVDDHGAAETCSQSQVQHFAALIAAQSLHGRIIDEFYEATEGTLEVKSDPPVSQVMGFRDRSASQHRTAFGT